MEPIHQRFLPDPSLTREEMEAIQREIAAAARFDDEVDPIPTPETDLVVAGIDQAFADDRAVSAVVCMRGDDEIGRLSAVVDLEFPYIPGLLSFREGGSMIEALRTLERSPDLFLVDGSGRIHFRQAGIATHLGVLFDVPTVGVIKSLLCGRLVDPPPSPFPEGTRVPIVANDRVEVPSGTLIGYALQTRQYESSNRHINPVYVSPGHRFNADAAARVVAAWCDGYKLPEPIRRADRHAKTVADSISGRD